MDFKRLRKPKKPNYIRSIIYILLLFLVIYLWMNAQGIIEQYFGRID